MALSSEEEPVSPNAIETTSLDPGGPMTADAVAR